MLLLLLPLDTIFRDVSFFHFPSSVLFNVSYISFLIIFRLLVLLEHKRQLCILMIFYYLRISFCPLNLLGNHDIL
jgi:hypothetical protein